MKKFLALPAILISSLVIIAGCSPAEQPVQTEPTAKTPTPTQEPVSTPTSTTAPEPVSTPTPTSTPAPTPQESAFITISNFAFSPSTLEITKGTKVTWTNKDNAPHSIVSQDGTLSSSSFNNGESFTFTFNTEGTYLYSCGIHPSMKGQITVK